MLVPLEKRKCKIIGGEFLGDKSENGTYSGILRMLKDNVADAYLKGEPDHFFEPWLKRTLPLRSEQ